MKILGYVGWLDLKSHHYGEFRQTSLVTNLQMQWNTLTCTKQMQELSHSTRAYIIFLQDSGLKKFLAASAEGVSFEKEDLARKSRKEQEMRTSRMDLLT